MIKAIIFDFDGVIVHSDIPRFKALQESAKKYQIKIKENSFKKMIGLTTKDFLLKILNKEEKKLINKIIDDFETTYKKNILQFISPVDLTIEFINNYKGNARFAVASGSSRKIIKKILISFKVYDKFDVIVGKEDIKKNKPDPEVYLKTLAKLKLNPSNCLVIEDSIVGAESAIKAKLKCFILINGINNRKEFSNLLIEDFISSYKDFKKFA